MREGRPGPVHIDLPIDVQKEIIEYDPEADGPLEVIRPKPNRPAVEKALAMLLEAERPLLVAGGGVINAEASDLLVEFAELTNTPVVPTLMGWGSIPDDHRLHAGMVGLQTQHRYGNATFLESDFVLGIGNRWANRHTGSTEVYTRGRRFVHVDIEPSQIGRVFGPDIGIVADAREALAMFVEIAREWDRAGRIRRRNAWVATVAERKRTMLRRTDFDNVPLKPQRVFQEINQVFDENTRFVTAIGLGQIASGQFQRITKPRNYIICGQAGPLGWDIPAAIGAKLADPEVEVVAVCGDYSFQFLIEELAVGAQYNVPFVVHSAQQLLPRPDPPGRARLRHGLRGPARLRQRQLARGRRLWRRSRQGGGGLRLPRRPGVRAGRHRADAALGEEGERRAPPAGGGGDDPRAGHQHRHGPRDRQDHRVRGDHRSAERDEPRARGGVGGDRVRASARHPTSGSREMKVGFIGVGTMGRPMAGHLIDGGHALCLHDVAPLPQALLDKGAKACASGKEVAETAEVIITMVPDTPHVEAALFGAGGVAEGLSAGKLVIDMSSISPLATKEFARRIGQKGCDVSRCAGVRRRGRRPGREPDHHGRRARGRVRAGAAAARALGQER